MNEYRNFCEFSKTAENTPKLKMLRVILMAFYTLFTLAYFIFFYLVLGQWQLLILLPFIIYAMIAFGWKFTKPEYEYSVVSGELTIAVIYGGKSRKVKFTGDLGKATRISEYNGAAISRDNSNVKDFGAGGEVWCAVFQGEGQKTVVIFSVNDKLKRALKIANPTATL